jgi:acetylornithine deacetylase/succinyl-diaminopimelate desuccinylase-like protein
MEPTQLLQKLVSIKSVFPEEKNLADFIYDYLRSLNFQIEKVYTASDRYNLVATYGKAKTYLGCYGHMDTVPSDPTYTRDPYSMWIEDNHIARGLGVCDMKSGLTTLLKLAEYASEKKLPLKLVFGVDEEDISQGAHDLCNSGLLKNIDFMIVAESGQLKNRNQDFTVCLGRKGRLVYEIVVTGKSVHAAESEKGINAIEKAAEFVVALKNLEFEQHPNLGFTNLVVQQISAKTDAFSVPDSCKIQLSLLTTPNDKGSDFIDRVQKLAKKLNIGITISAPERKTPYGESYEIDVQHPFFKTIKSRIFSKYTVEPIYTPSVADENVFANRLGIPVLSVGVLGGEDHTSQEWADLRSLQTLVGVYREMLEAYHV